jgi:3-(methylsulfanyl)propanoyl-CoA dehydrogenase
MPSYNAPVRDMQFVLHEVLNLEAHNNLPGFEEVSRDLVDAILEEGAKLTREVLQPLNQSGDHQGCTFKDGTVTAPHGFKQAYNTYIDGGWNGLTAEPAFGGQGLPYTLGLALSEMMCASNMSFAMYPGLTNGAVEALTKHASDELKAIYLPKLIAGTWTGTMNLTESHAGTDLGMMRTKAEPQPDGTYRITGTKIFISAGEHDLSENIIHLVLAKIPGGPEGTRGISLFVVPKFLVNPDGSLGARNAAVCGSIEEKMGIHGNSTCVMNYDGATGYLVGEEHKGMRAMFTMMNAARLGVGIQGLGLSEVAYQNAVAYAKDRLQGRSLKGPQNADKPADPIVVHPDVRRMLMNMKAFNEGARALAAWTGLRIDIAHRDADEKTREEADDLVGLLTPVIKAFFTDIGFTNTVAAQQCFGGHGYIREWGMEQFVRDARISQLYEGANGVQAMDLVGRKLALNGGRAIRAYLAQVDATLKDNAGADLADFTKPLGQSVQHLQEATMWLVQNGMADPENAGAAAMDYLYILGHVAMGAIWTEMAKVANHALSNGHAGDAFYQNKLATGRYYMQRMMPDTASHLAKLKSGAAPVMALDAEAF